MNTLPYAEYVHPARARPATEGQPVSRGPGRTAGESSRGSRTGRNCAPDRWQDRRWPCDLESALAEGHRARIAGPFATDVRTQALVGVTLTVSGADRGRVGSMLEDVEPRYRRLAPDASHSARRGAG